MSKEQMYKTQIEELENRIKDLNEQIIVDRELMRELIDLQILKTEVNSDIEKVWMYDATLTKDLSSYQKRKRSEAIERVFYKVANEWIDISDPIDDDEWGEMIPLPGSRIATKEEMEKYDKIKLPF